ncbi:hypothetical protein [Pseudomonas oryzihabitans]|nr:hypothetical protein [Pseudomonas psychrotolerans]NMY92414.1 hypothetical protein [Pseudomonas psychrotolerans]
MEAATMEESVASHTPRWSDWPRWIKQAVPLFVQVLPAFVALTLLAAFTTVSILLILGKAAFHLASLCSPLIFLVLALALRRAGMLGDRPVLRTAVGTGSPWRNFFRVAAPLALVIGIALNALAILAMLGSDIGAWKRGALPLTTLPLDLFSAEKRPLLVMLYTTAVEQQLSLMPLFVIMGGRLEPYLVAAVMAGRETWSSARAVQAQLSKSQKLVLGPMRLLTLCGVTLQATAGALDATSNWLGVVLLLVSIGGWLFYCCLIAVAARDITDPHPR